MSFFRNPLLRLRRRTTLAGVTLGLLTGLTGGLALTSWAGLNAYAFFRFGSEETHPPRTSKMSDSELANEALPQPNYVMAPNGVNTSRWSWKKIVSKIKPAWAKVSTLLKAPNQSYLQNTRTDLPLERSILAGNLMDHRTTSAFQTAYLQRSDNYEARRNYGQLTLDDRSRYSADMTDLSRRVFQEMNRSRIDREEVKQNIEQAPTGVQVSTLVMMTLVATSVGEPVRLKLKDDTEIYAKTDLSNRKGDLKVSSRLINSELNFRGDVPLVTDANRLQLYERYRFSLGRSIPLWDLRSGLTYGGTTSTLSASLTKPIMPGLEASVTAINPVGKDRPTLTSPEQRLSVEYKLRF